MLGPWVAAAFAEGFGGKLEAKTVAGGYGSRDGALRLKRCALFDKTCYRVAIHCVAVGRLRIRSGLLRQSLLLHRSRLDLLLPLGVV